MADTNSSVTQVAASTAPNATIATLAKHVGERVTLRGWLYNIRSSGKLLFPMFRDGTGTIQGIVPKAAVSPEVLDRKSTRLNSSHVSISYAVFCLKKKTKDITE